VLLALSLVPIAIVSNLLRVLFLVLLTFHAGDEAGQGFLHGFAGMFLFIVALGILFAFDRVLGRVPSIAAHEVKR
jgi:exosortase/archaeosortase family protein